MSMINSIVMWYRMRKYSSNSMAIDLRSGLCFVQLQYLQLQLSIITLQHVLFLDSPTYRLISAKFFIRIVDAMNR